MKKGDSVLYETGELDVLPYYSKTASVISGFLKGKRIASKIHLLNLFFLKRGSKDKPLYIDDFSAVNSSMLKLRKFHLKDARDKLNEKQALIWDYFVPRKLVQFFYATNDEGAGKEIERIFIDIDRRKHTSDDAKKVASELVKIIKEDKGFNKIVKIKKIVILWTGASFHIVILLKNKINLRFYNRYLSYGSGKSKEESFIMKWAKKIEEDTGIETKAGHEKSDKFIILDSSNTPSGKLARAPFSLHIKDWKTWDGVCVPVTLDELRDKDLIKKLSKLTPDSVMENLGKYRKLL